ncbi:MAG TPA: hypothetical protein VNQ73_21170 [Ilumatobacter sp.]|nr:hypothetical protein [Ilumatobacter sp.]
MLLRRLAAGVVGFAGLALEIAYTRIVSFKLFYYYTYFVIGLALLGFGAAATVTALSNRLRRRDALDTIRQIAPFGAAAGVVSYLLVARLPTNVNQIWAGTLGEAAVQLVVLVVVALALTVLFFALGIVISVLIVVDAADVRKLYFWDLVGAALGCLLAVPLQRMMGPPAMVLATSVVFAALGLLIAVRTRVGVPVAAGGVVVVLIGALLVGQLDVRTDDAKTLRLSDPVAASEWGAVFRVDAVPFGPLYTLHHDGLWGSSIWQSDGTPATDARFDGDSRYIPWATLGRNPERILIIGAAGGNEVQGALHYGAGHIDAVELNPVTHRLVTEQFAEYSGNFAHRPEVDYVQGDGRTFLARSDHEYDLIWFVAPDSYAASNAATSGAFVLSESYLYTAEMLAESWSHLSPDGMVVAQFGDFDFDTRPTRTARYLVTAREAIPEFREPGVFAEHAMLMVESDDSPDNVLTFGKASTIVLSRPPLDAAASARLAEYIPQVSGARAVHLPGGGGTGEGLTAALIAGDQPTVDRIVDEYGFDIGAITDDRPFFWHFTPYSDVLTNFSRGYEDSEIAIGERLLLMLFTVAVVTAAVLLFLPFVVSRWVARRAVGEPVVSPRVLGRWRLLVYFAALGLGFMIVEISMIQRFALLLGYPTLSLSVSLFTLLIATAVGARFSDSVTRGRASRLAAVVVAMWVVTLAYLVVADSITDAALAWAGWARIVLVVALLLPVGVLLGMFLPTGIDAARAAAGVSGADEGRLVAWCWAVNGFFSVIGSTATTMLSMTFGFNRTVVVGLVLYVAAAVVLATWRNLPAARPALTP